MSENDPIIYALIGIPAGAILFGYGWKQLKLKRYIEEIPTSKTRSIALGLIEIKGSITANNTIKSIILKKNCVFYHTRVEELRKSGKSSKWVTIYESKLYVPFYLEDETGKVLINPDSAKIVIKRDFIYQTNTFCGISNENVKDFCNTNTISFRSFLGLIKPLKFSEYFLEPGDSVYILGTAKNNPEAKNAIHNQDNIVITKGEGVPHFIISDHSEKELLAKFFWKSVLGIIGGPIIFLLSLWYILVYFGKI